MATSKQPPMRLSDVSLSARVSAANKVVAAKTIIVPTNSRWPKRVRRSSRSQRAQLTLHIPSKTPTNAITDKHTSSANITPPDCEDTGHALPDRQDGTVSGRRWVSVSGMGDGDSDAGRKGGGREV